MIMMIMIMMMMKTMILSYLFPEQGKQKIVKIIALLLTRLIQSA